MEKIKKAAKPNSLGGRIWFNLVLFGFMGQVAWAVENIYFNTFLFNYIGGTTADISRMVALSSVTAVIATFLMGTLSDKLNRRKAFLSGGYIAWGFTVGVFAFISRENSAKLFGLTDTAAIIAATVSIVIIMDCVMTFMGSTSNDAAFNAWITDITCVENRGVAEGVLSVLPIMATVIVSVVFGALVDSVGYAACFIGLGAVVTLCGIIGIFTVKDSLSGERKAQESYVKDLVYGFRPKVVKANKELYIALAAVCCFNIAVQIFLPYIFIYLQHYLNFDFNTIGEKLTPPTIIIAAVAIVGFIAAVIGVGKLIDRFGKSVFVYPSIIVFIAGLFAVSKATTLGVFGLLALLMLIGYGLLMIILNACVRDFTPENKAGQFQGIRMIFMVLLPMVIGPKIGTEVIEYFNTGISYFNEYGEAVCVPVPEMFIAAAVISVFIFIPIAAIRKKFKH